MLSSSSARVEEGFAVAASTHRLSSSRAAVLNWMWALQCSPSLASRPAVPHRVQLRPHWNEGGYHCRLCPPPMSILSSSRARVEEDLAVAASAHRPAVLASLSSSSAAVHNASPLMLCIILSRIWILKICYTQYVLLFLLFGPLMIVWRLLIIFM